MNTIVTIVYKDDSFDSSYSIKTVGNLAKAMAFVLKNEIEDYVYNIVFQNIKILVLTQVW